MSLVEEPLPTHDDLMWPILLVVDELGGSGSIGEISDGVIQRTNLSEAQQAVLHNGGPQTKINYRLGWARSHLKIAGFLENSSRGIWSLTEAGQDLLRLGDPLGPQTLRAAWKASFRQSKARSKSQSGGSDLDVQNADELGASMVDQEVDRESNWKADLLSQLLAMEPSAFERLAQRLLREADFVSVSVTGRTGDGGIDGLGKYRLSLVSFPVFFQCKRYKGSVGSGAVRDFRGAMAGRGDKGLLITTGTFTAAAKAESSRDGATPIDLIDGSELCDLLRRYGLGVRTSVRKVETVEILDEYFSAL